MKNIICFLSLLIITSCNELIKKDVGNLKTDIIVNRDLDSSISIQNEMDDEEPSFCALSTKETFDYLYSGSPFQLGSSGIVNFTKKFNYETNNWTESRVSISGGRARLEGDWKVISGNKVRVSNILASSGMFDASRNSGSSGILTINCNGDIEGTLRDNNGNYKDILIKQSN